MADLDLTNSSYIFKVLQNRKLDTESFLREHPGVSWADNKTDFTTAEGMIVPVEYATAQGAGTTEAIAAQTAQPSAGVKFLVPQRHYNMNAGLTRVVLQNCKAGGNDSHFIDAITNEMDGVDNQFGNHLENQFWGSEHGYRATVLAKTATTITVSKEDAQLVEVGQTLGAVDPAGAGTLRAGAGAKVTKVNRSTGVLTIDTTQITGLAVGDKLVGPGDFTNKLMQGVQDWFPVTVADTDNFCGVNRSADRERLAGVYSDQSGVQMRAAFVNAFQAAYSLSGGGFDTDAPVFLHPAQYAVLLNSVEANAIKRIELSTSYGIGLKAVEILGHKVIQAYGCPRDEAFCIGKGSFIRGSAGTQPKLNDHGQGSFLYNPDTGRLVFTLSHDGNFYSPKPYRTLRIKLQAAS